MMTLGIVPDWQFNPNPAQNPLVASHVVGQPNPLYQGTGIGPNYTSVGSYGTGTGLGFTMVDWNPLQGALAADVETEAKGMGMGMLLGLGAVAAIIFMSIKK